MMREESNEKEEGKEVVVSRREQMVMSWGCWGGMKGVMGDVQGQRTDG